MKKSLIIILLFATATCFGQYKPKKGGGLYSTGANEIDKGWFFGIGSTYTVAYPKETYNTSLKMYQPHLLTYFLTNRLAHSVMSYYGAHIKIVKICADAFTK